MKLTPNLQCILNTANNQSIEEAVKLLTKWTKRGLITKEEHVQCKQIINEEFNVHPLIRWYE